MEFKRKNNKREKLLFRESDFQEPGSRALLVRTGPVLAPGCDVRVSHLHFKSPKVEKKPFLHHDTVQRKKLLLPLWSPSGDCDPCSAIAIVREPWVHYLGSTKPVSGLEGGG